MELSLAQKIPFSPGQRVRVIHVLERLKEFRVSIGDEGIVIKTLHAGFGSGGGVLLKLDAHSGPICLLRWCLEAD